MLGLDPRFRQFQVVQSARDLLVVRLVLTPSDREVDLADVHARLGELAGEAMRVSIEICDAIPLTAAGKLLVVVNQWQRDAAIRQPAGER